MPYPNFKKHTLQFITPDFFEAYQKTEKLLQSGLRWVQYRDKQVSDAEFIAKGKKWRQLTLKYNATLMGKNSIKKSAATISHRPGIAVIPMLRKKPTNRKSLKLSKASANSFDLP